MRLKIGEYLSDFKSVKKAVVEIFNKFGPYHEKEAREDEKMMVLQTTKLFYQNFIKEGHKMAFLYSKRKILIAALKAVDEYVVKEN